MAEKRFEEDTKNDIKMFFCHLSFELWLFWIILSLYLWIYASFFQPLSFDWKMSLCLLNIKMVILSSIRILVGNYWWINFKYQLSTMIRMTTLNRRWGLANWKKTVQGSFLQEHFFRCRNYTIVAVPFSNPGNEEVLNQKK